jgi:hypothetical protein
MPRILRIRAAMGYPARPMSRAIAIRCAVVLGATLLTLAVAELGLRLVGFAPTFTEQRLEVKLDSSVLYRVVPNSREDFNSWGFRDREFQRAKDGRRRVVMVGDSFLMGPNVKPDQTIAAQLERQAGPGVQVYNLGILGYGPDQALVRLLGEGVSLDPDLVILTVFPANDFGDLYENKLFRVDADGELAPNPENPVVRVMRTPRLWLIARRALTGEFFRPGEQEALVEQLFGDGYDLVRDRSAPESVEKIDLMRAVLRTFQREMEQREIPHFVVILPSYENIQNDANFRRDRVPRALYFRNEELVVELCTELGLGCLDLSPTFVEYRMAGLYSDFDRHLSAVGYQLAAAATGRATGLIRHQGRATGPR